MHPFTINKFRGGLAVVFKDEEGKRHRIQLESTNKATANAEATEVVMEFFRIDPNEIRVGAILDAYIEHLGNRHQGRRLRGCPTLRKFFAPYKPSQITDELVKEYIAKRVNVRTGLPVSDETLWGELGGLRDAFSYAVKRKLLKKDDVPHVTRPAKPEPRDRPISRSEAAKLLAAAESTPHLLVTIALLLGTAARVSAALELTWDRVDFEANKIDLRVNSKGPRKGRAVVPMNPGLRRVLIDWKSRMSADDLAHNHVICFGGEPIKSIRTAFNNAAERAEIANLRPHDLRHTAAVWMLEAGSSIQRISQYLGHSSIQQTFKVYARYQPDHLRPEAQALDVSKLLPANLFPGSQSDDKEFAFHPMQMYSSPTNLSLVIDRGDNPGFAEFVEARGEGLIKELWRIFLEERGA